MNSGIKYSFTGRVWQHSAPGGWFFVTLPKEISSEIRELLRSKQEGWGRMKVTAQTRDKSWGTAIWFDTKLGTYLLPLKADIRSSAGIKLDQEISVDIWI